jgi:tRNA A-37 threonylcarbamoyl transferase component Bud32/predicted nucleotidyltransferase
VAEDVLDGSSKPLAVAAYGSKVAGYARPDSDYDLIVVAKKFRGKIKYRYVDSPVTAAALIVEEGLLEKDSVRAYLGEFASGRLLNVYEPLLNGGLFRKAEVDSKKRVLAEEILELGSQHGEFAQDLVIPLEYFLFNKLHKRAIVYPPALYSYIRTYTCPSGKENRAFTLDGFADAARSLEAEGVLNLYAEGDSAVVRIIGEGLRSRSFARMLSLFNLTTRGVRQYAVHGFAGRVGFNVFKDEALSKVKRMQETVDPPAELQEPAGLLGLVEGFAVPKGEQMIDRLASISIRGAYTKREKSLGEIYTTARLLTLRGSDGTEARYVLKRFADIRSVKWAILNVWSLSRKFSTSPQARMHREYAASIALREKGVATPRIVGAAIADKILAKEFIEGERLSDLLQEVLLGKAEETRIVEDFGGALGAVHKAGYALGDSKATNVIVNPRGLFFTDLEQATEGGDQAWDLADFLYYQAKLSLKGSGMKTLSDAFLKGYARTNGTENIVKARSPKYVAPFRPVTTPQMVKVVKESMEANS